MVNVVQEFLNEVPGEVRTFDKNGELWFVINDLATELEYKNAHQLIRLLDDDEIDSVELIDNNKVRKYTTTNMSGLLTILAYITKMNSKRYEKAKSFKKWICETLIPTLRKDGMYINAEENVTSQDELIRLGHEALMRKCERLEK